MTEISLGQRSLVALGPGLVINIPRQFARLHELKKGDHVAVTIAGQGWDELIIKVA